MMGKIMQRSGIHYLLGYGGTCPTLGGRPGSGGGGGSGSSSETAAHPAPQGSGASTPTLMPGIGPSWPAGDNPEEWSDRTASASRQSETGRQEESHTAGAAAAAAIDLERVNPPAAGATTGTRHAQPRRRSLQALRIRLLGKGKTTAPCSQQAVFPAPRPHTCRAGDAAGGGGSWSGGVHSPGRRFHSDAGLQPSPFVQSKTSGSPAMVAPHAALAAAGSSSSFSSSSAPWSLPPPTRGSGRSVALLSGASSAVSLLPSPLGQTAPSLDGEEGDVGEDSEDTDGGADDAAGVVGFSASAAAAAAGAGELSPSPPASPLPALLLPRPSLPQPPSLLSPPEPQRASGGQLPHPPPPPSVPPRQFHTSSPHPEDRRHREAADAAPLRLPPAKPWAVRLGGGGTMVAPAWETGATCTYMSASAVAQEERGEAVSDAAAPGDGLDKARSSSDRELTNASELSTAAVSISSPAPPSPPTRAHRSATITSANTTAPDLSTAAAFVSCSAPSTPPSRAHRNATASTNAVATATTVSTATSPPPPTQSPPPCPASPPPATSDLTTSTAAAAACAGAAAVATAATTISTTTTSPPPPTPPPPRPTPPPPAASDSPPALMSTSWLSYDEASMERPRFPPRVGLEHVLVVPEARAAFHNLCRSAFCHESLAFIGDVTRYRAGILGQVGLEQGGGQLRGGMSTGQGRGEHEEDYRAFLHVVDMYVLDGGALEVNIAAEQKAPILQLYKYGEQGFAKLSRGRRRRVFDVACKEVFMLISDNLMPRFRRSVDFATVQTDLVNVALEVAEAEQEQQEHGEAGYSDSDEDMELQALACHSQGSQYRPGRSQNKHVLPMLPAMPVM